MRVQKVVNMYVLGVLVMRVMQMTLNSAASHSITKCSGVHPVRIPIAKSLPGSNTLGCQSRCLFVQTSFSPNSLLLGVLNALKNGRLGAGWSGRAPGRLVSHLSFVSQFFSFVSQFFSFVSQAGCLWSGSRLACLPLPFICFPICLPGHFLSFVSHCFSFISHFLSLSLSPTSNLSPTSFHLSTTSFLLCPSSFHLSLRLGACGPVPGYFLAPFRWRCNISVRLSPRSVAGGVRPFPLFLFIWLPCLSLLISALFRWPCIISISQVSHCQCPPFSAGHTAFLFISQVCHCWCPPLSVGHAAFLFMCLPGLSLVVPLAM